jgi:hypothetical protein
MPSVWISALKEYNEKKGMWCLPKKGSAEHAEVMKIMDRMRGSKAEPAVAKEKPKRKLRTEKEKKESEMMAKEDKPEKKTRKAKAESESDSDVPVAKPKARADVSKISGADLAQYDIAKQRRNKSVVKAYEEKYPELVKKPAKAKAEPKAKKGTIVVKDKFVPQLRTAQEKQDYLEQRQLELMTEDFKKGLPLKLREKK